MLISETWILYLVPGVLVLGNYSLGGMQHDCKKYVLWEMICIKFLIEVREAKSFYKTVEISQKKHLHNIASFIALFLRED